MKLYTIEEYTKCKWGGKLPIKCDLCGTNALRVKRCLNSKIDATFCSRQCFFNSRITKISGNCTLCNKPIIRHKRKFETCKFGRFCSLSCSAKYCNPVKTVTHGSKAEKYLYELICNTYPQFNIINNCRTLLSTGYEVDILIEDVKLAIELNGPTHFFPIYGSHLLEKTILHDQSKAQELPLLGYTLLVIDISRYLTLNKTKPYLMDILNTKIIPFIERAAPRSIDLHT